MKQYTLYFSAAALLFSTLANAQVTRTSTQSNQAKTNTQPSHATQKSPTMSQTADSLKFAVNDFKKSMNTLFGSKKDTIDILIPDIEYDDANLSLLKESIKNTRGGKLLGMQYKSSAALLQISYKGSSTQLWDQLPADSKKAFKIVEVNENNMTLAVRK